MAHLPLAFSIHHFINSVGADAGFAAIIGLAILILLYFAQARETSTLRDRADAAEQRAGELEVRLAQVARAAQPAVRPAPPPAIAARPLIQPVASRAVAQAGAVPAAPAGVGAPALAAATRLIPSPAPPSPVAPLATPATAVAGVAAVGVAAAGAAATGAAATGAAAAEAAPAQPVVPAGPKPATAAAAVALAGNGAGTDSGAPSPGPATAVAASPPAPPPDTGTLPGYAPVAAPEPLPRVQLRSPGAPPPGRPAAGAPGRGMPASAPKGPSRIGRGVAIGLTLLGVVAVVAVLLIITSGSGSPAPSASGRTTNTPAKRHKPKPKPFDTAAVTVAVLNGTSTSGLAARVSGQLAGLGYKQGATLNAADQTHQTTTIYYLPGHRADAVHVAKSLKLPASVVTPVDPGTQAIACQGASACTVDVVVTLGLDLANR